MDYKRGGRGCNRCKTVLRNSTQSRICYNIFQTQQVELTAGADMISKTFTEREKCGLNFIDPMRLKAVGIPIKRNSGYKELMATRFVPPDDSLLTSHLTYNLAYL